MIAGEKIGNRNTALFSCVSKNVVNYYVTWNLYIIITIRIKVVTNENNYGFFEAGILIILSYHWHPHNNNIVKRFSYSNTSSQKRSIANTPKANIQKDRILASSHNTKHYDCWWQIDPIQLHRYSRKSVYLYYHMWNFLLRIHWLQMPDHHHHHQHHICI